MNENINLNLYKIFYEVAKNGSASVTAKKLYISQPAISKSIKALEQELHQKLFYRTKNGMFLTKKGEELYKCIDEAFRIIAYGKKQITIEENFRKGILRIGAPSHIVSFLLMERIYQFHQKHPNIEMTIVCRSTDELLKMLRNHDVDLVIDILSYKDDVSELSINKLKDMDHCFVMRNDSEFIDCTIEHDISEIKNLPLILPAKHSSHRQRINELAKINGFALNNVFSIETSEIIYDAIKNRWGIGYILQDIVKKDLINGTLKKINIKEKLPKVSLYLIYDEKTISSDSLKFINDSLRGI